MTAERARDRPPRITPVDGEVAIDGVGVGVSMTPDAADETGSLRSAAAAIARTQGLESDGEDST